MKLHPTVDHMPGETPASFAARLARINRVNAAEFCGDFGIDHGGLFRGKQDAIARLAELVGTDCDELSRFAWSKHNDDFFFRGQKFVFGSLRPEGARVCLACLNEDRRGSADPAGASCYFRAHWRIVHLRTCPVHQAAIVELPAPEPSWLERDFARRVEAQLDRLDGEVIYRAPSPLENYLLARLDGQIGARHWLEAFPVYAAARVCEMLGAVDLHGRRTNLNLLTDDDRHESAARGFEIASGGPEAVDVFLTNLRLSHEDGIRGRNGPGAWWGRLYHWLSHINNDSAFDPLREIARRNLINNVALPPNTTLFGKPVTERKVHSIRTAFQETGIHYTRLRRMLRFSGLIPSDTLNRSGGEIVFDAEAAAELLRREQSALTLTQLPTYLGTNVVQTKLLIQGGYIRSIIASSRFEAGFPSYAREDVDQFVALLSERAQDVLMAPEGAFQLMHAAKRACCNSTEIVDLLLTGKLSWVGKLANVTGYDAILVNLEEVRRFVRGPELAGLTMSQAHKSLRINPRALNAVVDAGLIATVKQRHPSNRATLQIVPLAEVDRFRSTYITLFEACAVLNEHHLVLRRQLADAGVTPVCDQATARVTLYRRIDVATVYPATRKPFDQAKPLSVVDRSRISSG